MLINVCYQSNNIYIYIYYVYIYICITQLGSFEHVSCVILMSPYTHIIHNKVVYKVKNAATMATRVVAPAAPRAEFM